MSTRTGSTARESRSWLGRLTRLALFVRAFRNFLLLSFYRQLLLLPAAVRLPVGEGCLRQLSFPRRRNRNGRRPPFQ